MPTPEPASDTPIRLTERYVLLERRGHGGFAVVWRAHDQALGREVAIKIPNLAAIETPHFLQRFARETRRMVDVVHPNVVPLLDAGAAGDVPFVVMPFLRGGTLRERRVPPPPTRFSDLRLDLAGWLPPVARALDAIHATGIVHRDVKPSNILFDEAGNPHVSDLGLAKVLEGEPTLTPKGLVVGTPATIAPEAADGSRPTPAFDQYGLATVVFVRLTGVWPFPDGAASTILHLKARTDAPLVSKLQPDALASTTAAVARGLARRPSARFPSCTAFANAVLG